MLSGKVLRQCEAVGLAQRVCYSTAAAGEKQFLSKRSRLPTYLFENGLPHLPIPDLKATCGGYLRSVAPLISHDEFLHTQKLVSDFVQGPGLALHNDLVATDKKNKHTSYISAKWYDMYLETRDPIPININPQLKFWDHPVHKTQVDRATALVVASLRFYQSLKHQVLEPEIFRWEPPAFTSSEWFENLLMKLPPKYAYYTAALNGLYPLDMSQYSKLFRTTRVPQRKRDEIVQFEDSKHIIVIRNNNFYKVDVLNPDGSNKSAADIWGALQGVIANEPAKPSTSTCNQALGLLTTENRDAWADLRAELLTDGTNKESLRVIDSALFALCLDNVPGPQDMAQNNRHFLHGDARNRWFDKSFSLIVTEDGQAGLNFEHSWGDGVAVLRYMNDIFKESVDSVPSALRRPIPSSKLQFNLNDKLKAGLDKAAKRVDAHIKSLDFVSESFPVYGKNFLKKHQIGPDGTAQMAFQLAYYRMFGKTVSTYESASTAAFKHGRTETIRSATLESREFTKKFMDNAPRAEKEAALRKAVNTHSALTKKAVMGLGVDRHLFAMRKNAEAAGSVPAIFKDKSYTTFGRNILSTSTLFSPAICGGGFGPVDPEGYGVGYAVDDNVMHFNVSSYQSNTRAFVENIKQSLEDIKHALEKK